MDLVAILGFFAAPGVVIAVVASCAHWALGPIVRAAKGRDSASQFSLADLLCLFFIIQLSSVAAWPFRSSSGAWLMYAYVWGSAGAIWWSGVRTLSRAGIANPWQRLLFFTVIIPGTLVCSMAVPLSVLFAVGVLFGNIAPGIALAMLGGGVVAAGDSVGLGALHAKDRRCCFAFSLEARGGSRGRVGRRLSATA